MIKKIQMLIITLLIAQNEYALPPISALIDTITPDTMQYSLAFSSLQIPSIAEMLPDIAQKPGEKNNGKSYSCSRNKIRIIWSCRQ